MSIASDEKIVIKDVQNISKIHTHTRLIQDMKSLIITNHCLESNIVTLYTILQLNNIIYTDISIIYIHKVTTLKTTNYHPLDFSERKQMQEFFFCLRYCI